jgi:DNA-binding MarR family transcriptional regulator
VSWNQLEEVDWLFRKMVRRFVKQRDKVDIEGVSLPGILVLQKLMREGDQRLSDLGEELDFTSGAVTGLCDKLEMKGLAKRTRNDDDRRTVWLQITEEGRQLLDRHRNVGTHSITTLYNDLTEEQLDQLIQLSSLMLRNIEQYADHLNRVIASNTANAASRASDAKPTSERPNHYLSY